MTLYEYLHNFPSTTYKSLPVELKSQYTQSSFNTIKSRHSKLEKCDTILSDTNECDTIHSTDVLAHSTKPLRKNLYNLIQTIKCFQHNTIYQVSSNYSILEQDLIEISRSLNNAVQVNANVIRNNPQILNSKELICIDLNPRQIELIKKIRSSIDQYTIFVDLYKSDNENKENDLDMLIKDF